ncbi:hypothetical protein [Streptomyces sp. NPDC093261]|uniref:hypothetical protein n=1 Tax=Streptomyces sp. NPDC093261 TaxID=3366037 RepID=UPI00381E5757
MRASLAVHGRLALVVHDAATGEEVDRRESDNLITTAGLNALAAALNWAFIENYNATWGNPFTATSGNLGDVYGAVGTSATAPAAGDAALGFEIGRQLVTNSAYGANQLTLSFFLPTTLGNGNLVEAGVFVGAGLVLPTLTSGLISGTGYTSLPVAGVTKDIPSGSTVTLGYATSQVQQVTTAADTPVGATTMTVNSFTANANYAAGQYVAYTPGTLLDHATFSPAIPKNDAQTSTLQLTLSLASG